MGSAMCGGVMSISQHKRGMRKYGVYFGMMSFLLPDDKYKEYVRLMKDDKKKEAKKVFDKYAMSQI